MKNSLEWHLAKDMEGTCCPSPCCGRGVQAVQHHDEGVHLCGDGRVARDDGGGEGGGADAQRPGVSHNQSGDKET